MNIGLVAAFHPETKILKKSLNFKKIRRSVFEKYDGRIKLLEMGIGKKNVEKTLLEFIKRNSFDLVINIGFAGAIQARMDHSPRKD